MLYISIAARDNQKKAKSAAMEEHKHEIRMRAPQYQYAKGNGTSELWHTIAYLMQTNY